MTELTPLVQLRAFLQALHIPFVILSKAANYHIRWGSLMKVITPRPTIDSTIIPNYGRTCKAENLQPFITLAEEAAYIVTIGPSEKAGTLLIFNSAQQLLYLVQQTARLHGSADAPIPRRRFSFLSNYKAFVPEIATAAATKIPPASREPIRKKEIV